MNILRLLMAMVLAATSASAAARPEVVEALKKFDPQIHGRLLNDNMFDLLKHMYRRGDQINPTPKICAIRAHSFLRDSSLVPNSTEDTRLALLALAASLEDPHVRGEIAAKLRKAAPWYQFLLGSDLGRELKYIAGHGEWPDGSNELNQLRIAQDQLLSGVAARPEIAKMDRLPLVQTLLKRHILSADDSAVLSSFVGSKWNDPLFAAQTIGMVHDWARAGAPSDPARADRASAGLRVILTGLSLWEKEISAFVLMKALPAVQDLAVYGDVDRGELQKILHALSGGPTEFEIETARLKIAAFCEEFGLPAPPERAKPPIVSKLLPIEQPVESGEEKNLLELRKSASLYLFIGAAIVYLPLSILIFNDAQISFKSWHWVAVLIAATCLQLAGLFFADRRHRNHTNEKSRDEFNTIAKNTLLISFFIYAGTILFNAAMPQIILLAHFVFTPLSVWRGYLEFREKNRAPEKK